MVEPHLVDALMSLDRDDVLSVSLDTDPTRPEHQGPSPAFRIWARTELRRLIDTLPASHRRTVADLAGRVLDRLRRRIPGRGIAIFATDGFWQEHVLPVPVPSRVRFGRPDLMPLLWAIDEYEPYAILAVDREHARVVLAHLGRATVVENTALHLDTRDWRFKNGRPPTFARRMGAAASRGVQRDAFDARQEEWVRRFWRGVAESAADFLRSRRIERLILGGPEEAAHAVRDLLPEWARERVVALVPLPSRASEAEIAARTLPVAEHHERQLEQALVQDVLERVRAEGNAVVGRAATLQALQQGLVQTLVADVGLAGPVGQCRRCGHVRAVEGDRCPVCGGPVEGQDIAQLLPALTRRAGARLELVTGPAAELLRPHEGIGALLRFDPTA
ncbi:MAG: VLRF1 family aeRF1-type release factor [Armatimonadota bacterium]|nr:VLRF1 family aeRF1-type release factor [Armatimonadota bacterium]MDR7401558.1 VLRF1 family aeRF1-type release factor [Armatimonadota bacterium]MDR7403300.1 VLRF1 family aeRF1-type release factor [Armatimonadota bacterium]MDR7438205.1 VLRF1 family aeRF1-type release factor [Armatimonadota bacterium]MDR7471634.1 VLRF1 family aeRF1-type release factor [Armatimonadota bacterium]